MLKNFLLVGLGGMIGSMIRYAAYLGIKNQPFPYATFSVNVAGSFIIGIIAGLATKNADFSTEWRLFLATGICGGFTTFSSFSVECLQLVQQNKLLAAMAYVSLSILLGTAAAFIGWFLSK